MSFEERRIADRAPLRALSHPLRLRLLELLEHDGPLTATEAAVHLDTTPSNLSFHLRLLARHGFVEEASGGVGRQRPWKIVERTTVVNADDLDADGRDELRAVVELFAERYRQNAVGWLRARDQYPEAWRNAAGETHMVLRLTADELSSMTDALRDVLARYERGGDRRPGTLPVAITVSTLPLRPPADGDPHPEEQS